VEDTVDEGRDRLLITGVRTRTNAANVDVSDTAPLETNTLGTELARLSMPESCRFWSSSPETTAIEIGTSRIDCTRFCAVTTISSTWAEAAEGTPTAVRIATDWSSACFLLTQSIITSPFGHPIRG
jgi:hypothetical protein